MRAAVSAVRDAGAEALLMSLRKTLGLLKKLEKHQGEE